MKFVNVKLGEILVNSGILTTEQLNEALETQKGSTKRLGEIFVDNGYLTESRLTQALCHQLSLPYVDVSAIDIEEKTALLIPETIAQSSLAIPFELRGDVLHVAMYDPLNYNSVHNIEVYTGLNVEISLCEKSKIEDRMRQVYASRRVRDAALSLAKNLPATQRTADQEPENIDQPVIQFINNMFEQAIMLKASDIHIEPQENSMVVRFRVDGHLAVYVTAGMEIFNQVVSRIKYIGGMNIAEKRVPQDGRSTYKSGAQDVDLRISVLPSLFGEKVVIRITTSLSMDMNINNIGFLPMNLKKFVEMIHKPYGIVLLTGPTGSGKTTTLYAAMKEIQRDDINIITVENPVEMVLPGATQVNINANTGLTFAAALRSVLRQDPDVIMVGEIRDRETADIACSMAITGHLVFSTLHTFDAPSSMIRLVDMGIEPFMVASSVVGVVAQRLLRLICPICKKPYKASDAEKRLLGIDANRDLVLYHGDGCAQCGRTGYRGRTSIQEIMPVSPQIRAAVMHSQNTDDIRQLAVKEGMISLDDNARRLVLDGVTTLEEIIAATSVRQTEGDERL